jgi:peptide/nickel transport system permease protein
MGTADTRIDDPQAAHAIATDPPPARPKPKGFWRIYVSRNKMGTFGIALLVAILLLAFVGPFFVEGENRTNIDMIYAPPSREAPLGYDHSGRDIWYQIVHGGRSLLMVSALAAFLATFIGVALGALMALLGGWVDSSLQMLAQVIITIPAIILLGVLAAFVRLDNPFLLAALLALTSWPGLSLAVRSQVLSLKEREYVEAARMLDLGMGHIMFREVLPNMMSYILINFVFAMSGAVYGQVALYFLGLVSMSGVNWGIMIQEAFRRGAVFNTDSMMGLLAPIFMIVMLIWALTLMARSLEDIFNPRLREL